MGIYDDLKDAVNTIIAHYKDATADGKLSFTEIFSLAGKATASFIQLFETFAANVTGAEKKAAVLAALETFFDEVIAPLDIKGIPNFIEPIVDSSLKKLSLTLADAGIDALVAIFNKSGWGPQPDPVDPGPQGPHAVTSPNYIIY
jgi:hypothetical protein